MQTAGNAFGQGFGAPDPDGWRVDMAADGALGPRIVAWVIDAMIVLVLAGCVALAFGVLTVASLGLLHPLFALLALVPFVYTVISIASRFAATPGQMLCGLSLRDAGTLERPSLAAALIWTLGYHVTIALGGIWLLVALITRRHRTLHDLVAGLVVVRIAALDSGNRDVRMFEAA